MINLTLDETLKQRLAFIDELGAKHMRPLGIEADRDRLPVPSDHPFFKLAWENGIGAARVPSRPAEKSEGSSSDVSVSSRRSLLLAEQMAYWDRGMTVAMPGLGLGSPPLFGMGTLEQQKHFLKPFLDKDNPHWAAFAMTEPTGGSDTARIKTRAIRDGDHWVLNGAKAFCSNGGRADWIVVWATVDPELGRAGHRAFIVEKGTPGVENMRPEHKMGLIAYESSSFSLNDCRVPDFNLLGGEDHYAGRAGFKGAMRSFNATRPAIGVMAVGIARAAFDTARDFVAENYMLDRPIPRYHKMKDKLGRMARKVETARMLCWHAAHLADLEQPNIVEASTAKAFAATSGQEVCSLAVDIMQDAGITHKGYVEKLYRDIKAMDLVEGTGQIQRLIIARNLVNLPNA